MTPARLFLEVMSWGLAYLVLLALLEIVTRMDRRPVFELWSVVFYGVISVWMFGFLVANPDGLFAPLAGKADHIAASMVGFYVANLAATKLYLRRGGGLSFLFHHLFFIAVFASGLVWYADKAPRILAWGFLEQVTGVTFHFLNAFKDASAFPGGSRTGWEKADYGLYFLVRVVGFPALSVLYFMHAVTSGAHDLFAALVIPVVFLVGSAFNIHWFLLKTRKLFPAAQAAPSTAARVSGALE